MANTQQQMAQTFSNLPLGGQSYKKYIYVDEQQKPGSPISVYEVNMDMDPITGRWTETTKETRTKSACGCLLNKALPPAGACVCCGGLVCYRHGRRCRECSIMLCPECSKRFEKEDGTVIFLCDTHYQEAKQAEFLERTCKTVGLGSYSILRGVFSFFVEVNQ